MQELPARHRRPRRPSDYEVPEAISKYLAEIGSRGGHRTAATQSNAWQRERARKGGVAKARNASQRDGHRGG